MTWTYLEPHNSLIAGTPTKRVFDVTAGQGHLFMGGPATEKGNQCIVESVDGDTITLAVALPYVPAVGDEFVQSILGDKDKVRLYCGDTDNEDHQLEDEEITTLLSLKPNILRAAALACEAIAAKLARKVKYQIYQEIQEDLTAQSKSYREQAVLLRREAARTSTIPQMGALLQVDKDLAVQDSTHIKPFFTRDMMTEPGTEPSQDESSGGFAQPFF